MRTLVFLDVANAVTDVQDIINTDEAGAEAYFTELFLECGGTGGGTSEGIRTNRKYSSLTCQPLHLRGY